LCGALLKQARVIKRIFCIFLTYKLKLSAAKLGNVTYGKVMLCPTNFSKPNKDFYTPENKLLETFILIQQFIQHRATVAWNGRSPRAF
jgi:hypothetical protein